MNINTIATTETMDLTTFSKTLTSLNKEDRHDECLAYFKQHYHAFAPQHIAENPYIISAVLNALRGTLHPERLQKGLSFLKMYHISLSDHTPEIILTSLAWLIYSYLREQINEHEEHEEETENLHTPAEDNQPETGNWEMTALELLPVLQRRNSDYARNAFSYLFSAMIRYHKSLPVKNHSFLKSWCEVVDIEQLSEQGKSITIHKNGHQQQLELASDKELYYVTYSRALSALQIHEACIEVCKAALNSIKTFHYQQDIWMRRRWALSLKASGHPEQAIHELLQVLKTKNEWYIRMELAELFLETGKVKDAITMGASAMLMTGELSFKVGLLYTLGLALAQMQEHEQAAAHFQLSLILRQQKGWSIPESLLNALLSVRDFVPKDDDIANLRKKLMPVWRQWAPETMPVDKHKQEGIVDKILHQNERGTNGFIRYNNDKTIYFSIPVADPLAQSVHKGMQVSFIETTSPDGKRTLAIRIKQRA